MKYKYTVLFGILFGATMNVLWGTVFTNILGKPGIGVGIAWVLPLLAAAAYWDMRLIRETAVVMSNKS